MAADVPYGQGLETVLPETAVPNRTITPSPTPEAFGGLVAHGEEQLGQGALKATDFYGEAAADQQSNWYQDQVSKILYGDPNKKTMGPDGQMVPDTGYMGLTGEAAMKARPQVEQQLQDMLQQARGNLTNANEQLQFDTFSRRYRAIISGEVGRYADQQSKNWAFNVNKASENLQFDQIANNATNQGIVDSSIEDLTRARVRQVQLQYGNDPTLLKEAVQSAQRDGIYQQIRALAKTNPTLAQQIADQNKNRLGVRYEEVQQLVGSRASEDAGRGYVQTLLGGGGAISGTNGNLRDVTAQLESSNGTADPNVYQFKGDTATEVGYHPGMSRQEQDDLFDKHAAQVAGQMSGALGRPVQNWETYLGHQQGAAGAAALLMNPDQNAIVALEPYYANAKTDPDGYNGARHAILDNGGNENMTAGQFAGLWRDNYARAGGAIGAAPGGAPGVGSTPSLAAAGASKVIPELPPLEDTLAAIDTKFADDPRADRAARLEAMSRYHQDAVARKQAEGDIKAAQTGYMQQIIQNYVDPSKPALDIQAMANDPKLADHPEIISQLIDFQAKFDRKASGGPEAAKNANDIFRRMYLPAGDPQRINSIDSIMDGVNQGKYGSTQAMALIKEFQNIQSADGEKLGKRLGEFFSLQKGVIVDPTQKDTDQGRDQEQAFYDYQDWVRGRVEAYRKEGKDPFALFDHQNKDYLGSPGALMNFKRAYQLDLNPEFSGLGAVAGVPDNQVGVPADLPAGTVAVTGRSGKTLYKTPDGRYLVPSGGQ